MQIVIVGACVCSAPKKHYTSGWNKKRLVCDVTLLLEVPFGMLLSADEVRGGVFTGGVFLLLGQNNAATLILRGDYERENIQNRNRCK